MIHYNCRMCGGPLPVTAEPIVECEYCGSRQPVPSADSEKKQTLFARANRLRLACEFDRAVAASWAASVTWVIWPSSLLCWTRRWAWSRMPSIPSLARPPVWARPSAKPLWLLPWAGIAPRAARSATPASAAPSAAPAVLNPRRTGIAPSAGTPATLANAALSAGIRKECDLHEKE